MKKYIMIVCFTVIMATSCGNKALMKKEIISIEVKNISFALLEDSDLSSTRIMVEKSGYIDVSSYSAGGEVLGTRDYQIEEEEVVDLFDDIKPIISKWKKDYSEPIYCGSSGWTYIITFDVFIF